VKQAPIGKTSSKEPKVIDRSKTSEDAINVSSNIKAFEADYEEFRSLLQVALEAYKDEYREISDSWRNTETKAQGAVAIAGIFMAGYSPTLGSWQKVAHA
jgi:hypothetical protein